MSGNKSLNQNLIEESEKFADELNNVLGKFEETKINEYFNLRSSDDYTQTFWIIEKYNGNDVINCWSVMDKCVSNLKVAVKELENVCTEYTKSFSEGGLFSISNIYLKKISKCAKAFYNDLNKLKSATNREDCDENRKKFTKSRRELEEALYAAANSKIKALKNPAKIQNERVKKLMNSIGEYVDHFYGVYCNYLMDCCLGSPSKKVQKDSAEFANALNGVLTKFKMTKLSEYSKLLECDKSKRRKTLVINKGNFVDTWSVMDECVYNLKIAVEALEGVCTKFTKSFSEGGFFSVSNACLKKISKSAKAFYRDLGNLKSATSEEICKENKDKFWDDAQELRSNLNPKFWPKVKTFKNSAKIQNKDIQNLMSEMSEYIGWFIYFYDLYPKVCFEQ